MTLFHCTDLTVTSPRSEEFDENGFTGDSIVPIVGSQLDGVGDSEKAEEDSDDALHGCLFSLVGLRLQFMTAGTNSPVNAVGVFQYS